MSYIKSNPVMLDTNNIKRNYILEDAIEDFLNTIDARSNRNKSTEKLKTNSYNRKKSDMKKFIAFRDAEYKNVKYTINITKEFIRDFTLHMQNLKKEKGKDKGSPIAPNTVIACFQSLKSFITYLAKTNAIKEDVYRYVYNSNFLDCKKEQVVCEQGFLTREQISEIYARTEKFKNKGVYYRNRAILGLLLHGFRRSEIIMLKWKDIDLDRKVANIILYKVRKKISVKLSDFVIADLKAHYESISEDMQHKTSYIFATRTGNSLSTVYLRDIIVKMTEGMTDSQGKPITTRTFRKTFVNINMLLNFPLHHIQNYTAHTTAVLQKHYQQMFPSIKIDTNTDFINEYFSYLKDGTVVKPKIDINDVLKDEELMGKLTTIIMGRMLKTVENYGGASIS